MRDPGPALDVARVMRYLRTRRALGRPRPIAWATPHAMIIVAALIVGALAMFAALSRASAWTVLRIPGWEAMSPDALDGAIRRTLRHPGSSVRVVARGSTPLPRSVGALVATPALIAWSVVTRLTVPERLSWLAWIWGLTGLAVLFAARQRGAAVLPNDGASSAGRVRRSPGRDRRAALRGR